MAAYACSLPTKHGEFDYMSYNVKLEWNRFAAMHDLIFDVSECINVHPTIFEDGQTLCWSSF